jgi:Meiotically Up-regulated Gene 113 (MUG113) protein
MAFVYVLRSGEEQLFKIGRTRGDLQARIRQLATGNPHRLTLFDHIETEYEAVCETYLHRRLRSKRSGEGDAREFFALTPTDVADALRDARDFLAEFVPKQQEAERLAREESDGVLLKPSQKEWELYRRLLEIRENEYSLNLDRALVENQLKLVIGKADGLEQIATWKSHEVKRFDEAGFKLAEPKLFEAFVRASFQRKFRIQ